MFGLEVKKTQSHGLSGFFWTMSHVVISGFADIKSQSHGISGFCWTMSHVTFGFRDSVFHYAYKTPTAFLRIIIQFLRSFLSSELSQSHGLSGLSKINWNHFADHSFITSVSIEDISEVFIAIVFNVFVFINRLLRIYSLLMVVKF
jgi:hypothetical protein